MQQRIGRTFTWATATRAAVAVLLSPLVAHAEPSASTSHIPMLWLIVLIGAGVSALIPLLIRKRLKSPRPAWQFWLAALLAALAFLIFVGPIIVIFGSILITGRTM